MNKRKSTGILNEGKENKFINNKVDGFDIGFHDKGEKTIATDNSFNLHERQIKWYQTWWGKITIGLFVLIVGSLILKYVFHI